MTPSPTPQPSKNVAPLHNWVTSSSTPAPTPSTTDVPSKGIFDSPAGILVAVAALVITVALLFEGMKQKAFGDKDNSHKPQGWR